MSQIAEVLAAVERGATTVWEVCAATGLPRNLASARLADLAADGLIRFAGETCQNGRGRRAFIYERAWKHEVLERICDELETLSRAMKTTYDLRGVRQAIDDWLMEEAIERENL